MTAAELLAELTARGFRLDVCAEGIGVVPASQLTAAQIQAIRERKPELLVLLGAEASPAVQVTATKEKGRGWGKRCSGSEVPPNGERGQMPPASNATLPPSEVAAVPAPVEARAESPAVRRTTCCRCGARIYNPTAERCWLCGGLVDVPELIVFR